ncbi:MAG TPA: hypothetical protein VGS19_28445 [Streptosporangiaceae bacterium]|nr:hypothetical protein [Streptosporangiaceae bacterium]
MAGADLTRRAFGGVLGGAAALAPAGPTKEATTGAVRAQAQRTIVISTGNAIQLNGCTLTNGSTAATFPGAHLAAGDVGKSVVAVNGTDRLVTTIAAVTSATGATLATSWPGATTSGAQVTYGTDFAPKINADANALGALGGGEITLASPVLCLSTLSLPNGVAITGFGFSLGSVIYAGHYANIIQSSLWGKVGTPQNQFCDITELVLIGLLPVTQPTLGQTDSTGNGQYLFTTVQLGAGTLSQTFTNGTAFPVSSNLDSRWHAGSASSPVYFWHNNTLYYYTSATPFAVCQISDSSVASANIITHAYVYPHASQGHAVAFQSVRSKISRVRTLNTLGSGVRVQGSGTADPTAYGHKIEWIRAESPGWACVDLGEATTDDFADIISGTFPGVAGVIVMGGDPTIRTVHIIGDATRPWVPHVVACPTNGSYRDIILDTCYGPGFVFDAGLQFRGTGPSQSRLDGLRYLASDGKPGHGIPILIKTRSVEINADHLAIGGVTFDQTCAFLLAHGPQTQAANGANVTVSTTPAPVPVLDVTAFDPMGGKLSVTHSGTAHTPTYSGTTVNSTLTSGSQQTVTIGSGGTLTLNLPLSTQPTAGDWYIVGGVVAVQVSPSNSGGGQLVYSTSVSLYGATGSVDLGGGSFVSRQALTGVTLPSGTQTLATGDQVVQSQLQQGTVQGSLHVGGATGMTLPVSQSPVSVKPTDSLLLTQDSQLGTGLGVTTAGPLAGYGTVTVASGATTGRAAHGLTVRSGNTPSVMVTPTAVSGLPSGCTVAGSADATNVTVTLSAAATASTTFSYFARVAP